MACPMWVVLPVPPAIELKVKADPKLERKQMDDYVKDYVVRHGYKITISHSTHDDNCKLCHYDCHRSGNPARPKPKKINSNNPTCSTESEKPHGTRSIKIQCPFRMTAKLDEATNTWVLHHVRIGHNHGPADTVAKPSSVTIPTIAYPPEPTSVTLPTIAYAPEIDRCATRIQQLSPRRQTMVLQEVHKIIDQYSARHSITSPPVVNDTALDEEALNLALQFLNGSEENGSKADHGSQHLMTLDNGILVDQAQRDKQITFNDQIKTPEVISAEAEVHAEKSDNPNYVQVETDANENTDEIPLGLTETNAEKVGEAFQPSKTKCASSSTRATKNKKPVNPEDSHKPKADNMNAPRTTRSGARKTSPAARLSRRIKQKTA